MSNTVPAETEAEARARHLQRHVARQQVATPLSLLIFAAASVLGATIAKPTLRQINDDYLTVYTPVGTTIGFYWIVLFALLVGQYVFAQLGTAQQ